MIGRDDGEEEVTFKVADRRKFNADGSVRDGIVLEPETTTPLPAEELVASTTTAQAAAPESSLYDETVANEESAGFDELDRAGSPDDEIPGADDPASFVNFLSTLATNAAVSLGAVPHPATGKRSVDLETGKYWLDVLAMISEKTKGNLHPQEARLLEGLLADLRMQYVTVVRATEEKLKAQTAQKFSRADILGKK